MVEGKNPGRLIDPRPPANRQQIVEALTKDLLRKDEAPAASDPAAERLRWTLRAWELAMTFIRLDREKDSPSDLGNDPIDAVHYALAATFCGAIATSDRDICRIRSLLPIPRCPLLWVTQTSAGVSVASQT